VAFDRYCPLVGPNGAGKSTILEAIRFVLDPRHRVVPEQCNPDCAGRPLCVRVTLAEPSSAELSQYGALMMADHTLTISREAAFDEGDVSSQYFVSIGCLGPFQPIRDLLHNAENVPAKTQYDTFATSNPAYGLETVSKYSEIEPSLHEWELSHPEECTTVSQPILQKDFAGVGWPPVNVIYVPAVKDASEDIGARSPLQRLLDVIVSEPANANADMTKLREYVRKAYQKIYPEDAAELTDIASVISQDLAAFAPGSSIELGWTQGYEPPLEPPPIAVKVVEDAYASDIAEKGHGVQRAVIMAVISVLDKLQEMLETMSGTPPGTSPNRDLLLLIEEPELYQHPIRARHFAEALRNRAKGANAKKTQVIFSTHSPNFISLSDFPGIRLLKRLQEVEQGKLPKRSIGHTTLDAVAKELYEAQDGPTFVFGGEDLSARLHGMLDSSVREGFFADSIVLVEGDNDYGTLVGSLRERGFDYEAFGLAILVVNGKNNLDKALVIFRQLGIPTYVLFDGDANKMGQTREQKGKASSSAETKANRALLKLLGQPVEDFPSTTITGHCAYFSESFDKTLVAELGKDFLDQFVKSCREFGYEDTSKARKVPEVFAHTLRTLSARDVRSETLERVADAIETFSRGARAALRA
jgi:putative ATP-dependent endonuclease of OLD family